IEYEDGEEPTRLYSTNKEVNIHNWNKLNDMDGRILIYKSDDWSVAKENNMRSPSHDNLVEWIDKSTLAEETLYLKINAEVLLIWNNKNNERLVNGSEGKVVGFKHVETKMEYRNEIPKEINSKELVPIVKFKNVEEEKVINRKTWIKKNNEHVKMVTRTQFPLKLRYSISIHKSQDKIDYGIVVFRSRAFTQERKILICGIKAKNVNRLHVESFISMINRTVESRWNRYKIFIVCDENASIKDEARFNRNVYFVRYSNLLALLSLESYTRF
ncbi:15065_t:CDS:2, partial [Cetraspora pellucida]